MIPEMSHFFRVGAGVNARANYASQRTGSSGEAFAGTGPLSVANAVSLNLASFFCMLLTLPSGLSDDLESDDNPLERTEVHETGQRARRDCVARLAAAQESHIQNSFTFSTRSSLITRYLFSTDFSFPPPASVRPEY